MEWEEHSKWLSKKNFPRYQKPELLGLLRAGNAVSGLLFTIVFMAEEQGWLHSAGAQNLRGPTGFQAAMVLTPDMFL